MRICIMPGVFPAQSETFVMQHVTGLLDEGLNVHVLANHGDDTAWNSLTGYESTLKDRIWYYTLPVAKKKRIKALLQIAYQNISKSRFAYFKSWNVLHFHAKALSLTFPYMYHTALNMGPIDILHCHFGRNGVFGAYLKELGLVKKLVITFHGYDVSSVLHASGSKHPYHLLFKEADLILPVSSRWEDKLIKLGAPRERTLVHRVGIDVERFKYRERKAKQNELSIVTTARFTEKKGLQYAVRAISQVIKSKPGLKIRYTIIGDGPDFEKIKELVRSLELHDIIELSGALPHGQVQAILAEADIFLLPSVTAENGDQEGIPVSLMEAMASGMPVLSTQHSGIPELVDDGISGFLVPERDSQALAERIVFLADNCAIWPRMGRSGRKKIEDTYNNKLQVLRLVKHYETLMSR